MNTEQTSENLNVLFRAYNLIIKRITRSTIIVEINTKDVKLVKTNISSLCSKRHLQSIYFYCILNNEDQLNTPHRRLG